jgi:hypothetical protein
VCRTGKLQWNPQTAGQQQWNQWHGLGQSVYSLCEGVGKQGNCSEQQATNICNSCATTELKAEMKDDIALECTDKN